MATKPPDSLAELSLGERAAIGRIEKALFGGDDRLVEVGRYEVGALIGSGAFGKVYRARDPELARDVALKVTAASDADRDELMREARVMATIRHPNVAAVHDAGIVGASVFIAMELVTGVSLRDWSLQRKMNRQAAEHAKTDAKQNVSAEGSRAATIDILCQAGRGLAAAHAAGIVHRDFKPENVLVDESGRAQVIDFGLAHVGGADARVAGTPAYMAPELLALRPAHETIDPRAATQASDQFAFAVTFCEAMFGARPFAGSTLAELRASLERPPVLPRDRLRPILTRALSRHPAGRFPSVTALVDAIERTESRVSRWWIAVGATAVVAGVVAFVVMRGREPADPCPLPVAELEGAWDAAARATVATAMHSVPRGDEIFARVSVKLDRAAVAWLDARHDACVATAVRHDQSPQMLDRRVACLRGWKRQLAGITHVLARPAPDTLAAAPRVLDDLPSLSRCRDADALAADPPPDPAAEDALADAREELASGHAAQAVDAVRKLGTSGALAIAAPMLEADALVAAARFDEARAAARRTFDAAIAGSDKRAAARAAATIAFLGSYDPSHIAESLQWVESGKKLIATLDDVLELDARLANAEGNLELAAGVAPAARTALARAVDDFKKLDPDHWALGTSLAALGAAEQDLGYLDDAERDLRDGLARAERDLGPDHVEVATTLINLGLVEAARGHYSDAERSFGRAVSIIGDAAGPDDARLAYAYLDRSQVEASSGDRAAAERDLDEADRIASASFGPEHPFTAQIAMAHAAVLADAGDSKALAFATRAFAVLSRTDSLSGALAEATLARALAAAGKHAEGLAHARTASATVDSLPTGAGAVRGLVYQAYGDLAADPTALRAALAAYATGASDPFRLAEIRFALARATKDPAVAREALRDFPRDGAPAKRAAIQRWLDDNSH